MAKSKFKKMTSIKDTEGGNFGNYDEGKGGGTPRGGIWGGRNGRIGWDERAKSGELPEHAHREDQPRTSDGKITYNSTNGKETKYESRGKTVNPLLTGGQNGIKIKDVERQFEAKSGGLYEKYKDKWYQKGSKMITKEGKKYTVKLSNEDIWEIARRSFDISKGGFDIEDENWDETKRGRRSKEEKAAMQDAKKAKGETFVKGGDGAIATRKYTDEERAKISSDRETRREFVDYLKGKYGITARAFDPNGTSDSLTSDEKRGIVDMAKKMAASRIFRKAATPKPAPSAGTTPTPSPRPTTTAPKPAPAPTPTSAKSSEAIIPEKAPEGKIYKYEKASNMPTLKAGTRYDADTSKKVSDQISAMEDLTDEDKENLRKIFAESTPEKIDEFIDDLVKSGFVTL